MKNEQRKTLHFSLPHIKSIWRSGSSFPSFTSNLQSPDTIMPMFTFLFLYLETRITSESTAHRHCVVTTPPFQKPSPSHCAHSWQPSLSKYMHDVIFQSRIGRRFGVGAEGGAGDEKVRRHEKVDGVNRICFGRGFSLRWRHRFPINRVELGLQGPTTIPCWIYRFSSDHRSQAA